MDGRGALVSPFCALNEDFSRMVLKDLGR